VLLVLKFFQFWLKFFVFLFGTSLGFLIFGGLLLWGGGGFVHPFSKVY